MRILPIIVACAISIVPALAQETSADAVFVPATATSPSKVVYSSGTESLVYKSADGMPPDDCPDGAFWVKNDINLVSCANGETYRFVPVVDALKWPAYSNAMSLEKIEGDPRPGTDDPGPMKHNAPTKQETQP